MERIIETIEKEHKEWFPAKPKITGCIYEIKYDDIRNCYITQLKYSWNKNDDK